MKFTDKDRVQLITLLTNMDVPRKHANDIVWLGHNLFRFNHKHKHFAEVMTLLRRAQNINYVDLSLPVNH